MNGSEKKRVQNRNEKKEEKARDEHNNGEYVSVMWSRTMNTAPHRTEYSGI